MPDVLTVENAAWLHLTGTPGLLTQLQAAGLGYDPADGPDNEFASGWVFAGDPDGNPYRSVDGTGKAAVVLYSSGEWTLASQYRSTQYPRLYVAVYADHTRDPDTGAPLHHDAKNKVKAIRDLIHPLFHDPANQIHAFGPMRVHSTLQGGPWSVLPVPDKDGLLRGECAYNLHID